MTRSIFAGLLGLFSIAAVGALPLACQSGGIGDPCIPEDEYSAAFAGFKVTEENIESRSFQCSTRICLVNHFQGRTTCPEGQAPPVTILDAATSTQRRRFCTPTDLDNPGHDKGTCLADSDDMCVEADTYADDCDRPACKDSAECPNNAKCDKGICADPCPSGLVCNTDRKVCGCVTGDPNTPDGYSCVHTDPKDPKSLAVLKSFVCHAPGNCQAADADAKTNAGKDCCVPGTDTPTTAAVCGQCTGSTTKKSTRSADQAVYCSCRCGIAEGAPAEDNFNFCECPTGFSCSEVRPAVGLGDPLLTGKYCVKEGTEYKSQPVGECGAVSGFFDSKLCQGTPGKAQ